jgi:hypothetical protein
MGEKEGLLSSVKGNNILNQAFWHDMRNGPWSLAYQ